jgi:glycosyltransferase involved in cell wall biosynthesis
MPTYSIITAVLADKDRYIAETYKSIVSQQLPPGWEWEWLVQEDGTTGGPASKLPADDRISAGMAQRGRAATARTIALGRASGILSRAIDADDIFTPGAIARDIETIAKHDVAWCVSAAIDLLPNGELKNGPRDPDPGLTPAMFFFDGLKAGQFQLIGTTMCAYTSLLHAIGGWPAVPIQEDVHILLAAETVAPGAVVDGASIYYRRWPGATTIGVDKSVISSGDPALSIVGIRHADALREAGWHWKPKHSISSLTE